MPWEVIVPSALDAIGRIFGARAQRKQNEFENRMRQRQFEFDRARHADEYGLKRDEFNESIRRWQDARDTAQHNVNRMSPMIDAATGRVHENLQRRATMPNFQSPVGNNPWAAGGRFNMNPQRPNYTGVPWIDGREETDDRLRNAANRFPGG